MLNLLDTVRSRCGDLDPAVVDRHFQRLPSGYFERYAAADIIRHLRLIAALAPPREVEVEFRPLAAQTFEVTVAGIDRPGAVASITASLAALGFNLEDVQVSTYLSGDTEGAGLVLFITVLRVTGNLRGRTVVGIAEELRRRLNLAFGHLAQGNLLDAQTISADTRIQADSAQRTPSPAEGAPVERHHEGQVVGSDYRLQRKLAVGGMSEVYLATQISLNRTVVVKLMGHELGPDDEHLARFYQEGMVLGQFTCPYIVQVFAAGTMPGRAGGVLGWLAMEYMAGGDLARWQNQHGCPPVELAARWLRETLEGLHYAHRHAVLHRDLKPHNLLLSAEGHVKVSDFGLFKRNLRSDSAAQTPRAAVVGTPNYMSPEQALGEVVDERSDIFSLGTTFFSLLSGRLPFDRNTAAATLLQIAQEDAPRLSNFAPQVPLALDVIIGRMMARRREERYQDVGVILEDLASYERRGLLTVSDDAAGFLPVRPEEARGLFVGGATQSYPVPPLSGGDEAAT